MALQAAGRRALVTAVATAACLAAVAVAAEPRHGLSAFGDLKYGADFTHFAYVEPGAPKGGTVRLQDEGSFDNLNPFILKGIKLAGMGAQALRLPFESLMTRAQDEPDAMYGLVAESADLAADRSAVAFTVRGQARWHDGTPITANDVAFSAATLRAEGDPAYRLVLRDVQSVVAESPGRVVFRFVPGAARDMPLIVAGLPILSQAYYQGRAFDQTTLEPPLGSGPYRVAAVDQGRSLTYARVTDWWGQDLPVNRGRYNFDRIRFDFFRDRDVAFEAFKAGGYDFREEFTSKTWATGYNTPAIRSGLIKRETLPDASPSGTQAFFINTRRPQLADVRVRHALGYAFDFEWTNENLFYGLYQRTTSMFENSDLRHRGAPSAAELDLLEPFRAELPAAVFAGEFAPPVSDGSGTIREQLRAARTLLEAAGYRVVGGKLLDPTGAQLEVEFLIDIPSFERIIAPIARNLERLGIAASIRIVDSAQYANRLQTYDYDIVTQRFSLDPTPGIGLRNIWGSAAAEQQGGANLAGVRNPVVDALIERLGIAQSREELKATVSALDRVLLWNFYSVPQWYKPSHFIAYRDVFGRPDVKPAYDLGFLDTWWVDAAKAAAAGKLPSAGP